jgi:hypothetical protein
MPIPRGPAGSPFRLMQFRDWLARFRNERSKRMIERPDGGGGDVDANLAVFDGVGDGRRDTSAWLRQPDQGRRRD